MKKIILISVLLSFSLISCHPELFELNTQVPGEYVISGYNMSADFEDIEFYADNAMRMYPGSKACMMLNGITDFAADMTVQLLEGQGLKFFIRSNCNYYPDHPAITFEYRIDGYIIKEDDRIVVESTRPVARYGERVRIVIHNYAKNIMITADCDTLCRFDTYIPNTEYIIAEALPGSSVDVSGISFTDTDDWEDSDDYIIQYE